MNAVSKSIVFIVFAGAIVKSLDGKLVEDVLDA